MQCEGRSLFDAKPGRYSAPVFNSLCSEWLGGGSGALHSASLIPRHTDFLARVQCTLRAKDLCNLLAGRVMAARSQGKGYGTANPWAIQQLHQGQGVYR